MVKVIWFTDIHMLDDFKSECNFRVYSYSSVLTFQVENELRDICMDILEVIDKHLIPSASTGESKVFYYKM